MDTDSISSFDHTCFDIDLQKILKHNLDNSYQIYWSDSNRDILSKILFLSRDFGGEKYYQFKRSIYF